MRERESMKHIFIEGIQGMVKETDHFSTYVLVEQEKEAVVVPPVIPNTGDNTIYYTMAMLIGLGVVFITNKKRHLVK